MNRLRRYGFSAHRHFPKYVGGISFRAKDIESGVGEEDGEEGVGEDFQDAGGPNGVGMGSGSEGEVSFVLELQDEFGQERGVSVELLAGGGAGCPGLASLGEDTAGQ